MEKAKIGVLTISDRASKGIYEDISGKAIIDYLNDVLITPFEVDYRVIPDELELIKETLIDMIDNKGCSLILTTGGTGPAKRDVTPEATEAVCEKMMPGFGELMRQVSLSQVPTAILSRQTAGIRKNCLIVNLPGKPQSIKLCLDAVMSAIPYCIDLIEGVYIDTDPDKIKSFRPKNKWILVVFIKFKKRGPSDLRFQDDGQRLNDKHYRKGSLRCHSAAGEESPTFIEFLARGIRDFYKI